MFTNMKKLLKKSCGFTLMEMLTVMMILGILAAIVVPSYQRYQIRAREAVLAEDLYQMRRAIDAFYSDYGVYPDSLVSLVDGRYLRSVPRDPFTRRSDTWKCVPPQYNEQGTVAGGNCADVFSSSKVISLDGQPYFLW